MQDDGAVRTTLDIDDDVLLAVKTLSRQRRVPAGRLLSELARKSLTTGTRGSARNGVPLFPVRSGGGLVTMDLVKRLQDEEP